MVKLDHCLKGQSIGATLPANGLVSIRGREPGRCQTAKARIFDTSKIDSQTFREYSGE
jgi:hypothetical protein